MVSGHPWTRHRADRHYFSGPGVRWPSIGYGGYWQEPRVTVYNAASDDKNKTDDSSSTKNALLIGGAVALGAVAIMGVVYMVSRSQK